MADVRAIAVSGLSKAYKLHHDLRLPYRSLRETMADGAKQMLRCVYTKKDRPRAPQSSDEVFWALKNVSFTVERGMRLGIVGRNGAGKSTLLKILSRITEPTEGRIEVRGRVSSLLEVGTGFHPELTGRENIFLNGTILGMTSREIRTKFDEIVSFAEIERFLDTPVKRYSSGMYVRLAFAVAAHLEPDTLIVDEVLAVGDLQFQRKCLGRMEQLSTSGRTILFVTHNMDALLSLCTNGILLDRGEIAFAGTAAEAREKYMEDMGAAEHSVSRNSGRGGSGGVSIRDVWLEDSHGRRSNSVKRDARASLCLSAEISQMYVGRADVDFAFGIDSEDGRRLFTTMSSWRGDSIYIDTPEIVVACDLDDMPLVPGKYLISASIVFRGDTLESIEHCASFNVVPNAGDGLPRRLPGMGSLDLNCRFRSSSDGDDKGSK